jgi:hypothetical protein
LVSQSVGFGKLKPPKLALKQGKRKYLDLSDSPNSLREVNVAPPVIMDSKIDLVDIPVDGVSTLAPDQAVERMSLLWDDLMAYVNKLSVVLKQTQFHMQQTLDSVEEKVESTNAWLGRNPMTAAFENCFTAWDGLSLIQDSSESIKMLVESLQTQVVIFMAVSESKSKAFTKRLDDLFADVSPGMQELANFAKTLNDDQISLNRLLGSHAPLASWPSDKFQDLKRRVIQLELLQ